MLFPISERYPDFDRPLRLPSVTRRAERKVEAAVYEHAILMKALSLIDQIDSMALRDAFDYAHECKSEFLKRGLERAGDSRTEIEMLADDVDLFHRIKRAQIID